MKVSINIAPESFIKKMRMLEGRYQKAIEKELGLTARDIESAYKIAVPVDTSRLRSSIHVETGNGTNGGGQNSFKPKPKEGEIFVGSNVLYARIIERKGGKTKGKDALLSAFNVFTRNLPTRIKSILGRIIP